MPEPATSFRCFPTGNRSRHALGHIIVRCPEHPAAYGNGYVPEHRLVMERVLGRFLGPGEKVRHRNGHRADNRPENLELVPPKTKAERFWGKVARGDGCWEWTGRRHRQGYGVFWVGRTPHLAHRVAYELAAGPVPAGLCVCHRCDNPPCVNPAHLFVGTQLENMADMKAKGRGHAAFTKEDVEEIRRLQDAGLTQKEIAGRFGVGVGTVIKFAPVRKRRSNGSTRGRRKSP